MKRMADEEIDKAEVWRMAFSAKKQKTKNFRKIDVMCK